jgi:hypothetical protein
MIRCFRIIIGNSAATASTCITTCGIAMITTGGTRIRDRVELGINRRDG